jgi:hypothetical protein
MGMLAKLNTFALVGIAVPAEAEAPPLEFFHGRT